MRKRLTPIGNSLGLILDKAILELLQIDADTELDITTDGERLLLTPARKPGRKPERKGMVPAPPPMMGFPKKQPW